MAKSQKGKMNKARNVYPYRFSCGGYDKLEHIGIEENTRQIELELRDPSRILDHNTSLSSCHDKWKRALNTRRRVYIIGYIRSW